MTTQAKDSRQVSVAGAVLHIRETHGVNYSTSAIHAWIKKGRRSSNGHVRFLKTEQMGFQAPIEIKIEELDEFIAWLKG